MDDATSVLFDLPGFVVIECVELDDARRTVIMQIAEEHGCPRCGVVVGGKPYDTRESRIKDLPFGERPLIVIWRKRRYRCLETSFRQRVFVERSAQIWPGPRSSERLRRVLARADGQCRAYPQVAVEYGCRGGWSTTSRHGPQPSCRSSRRRCGGWALTRPAPAGPAGTATQ